MADVSAIFGILLVLAIVFPGLMVTVWLLFPDKVAQEEVLLRVGRRERGVSSTARSS